MEDTPYNKRELDHFLGDMKDQLTRIETQVLKTNGRTTANEVNISNINTRITTTIAVGSILLPMVLGLGGYIFYLELQAIKDTLVTTQASIPTNDDITKGVNQALDGYQSEMIEY